MISYLPSGVESKAIVRWQVWLAVRPPSFQPEKTSHMIYWPGPLRPLPPKAPSPWILKVSLPCSSQLPHRDQGFGRYAWAQVSARYTGESTWASYFCFGKRNQMCARQLSAIMFTFSINWHSRFILERNCFPPWSFHHQSWLGSMQWRMLSVTAVEQHI